MKQVKSYVTALLEHRRESEPDYKRCQAYEEVSMLLGYKNWNTLCGCLKNKTTEVKDLDFKRLDSIIGC